MIVKYWGSLSLDDSKHCMHLEVALWIADRPRASVAMRDTVQDAQLAPTNGGCSVR